MARYRSRSRSYSPRRRSRTPPPSRVRDRYEDDHYRDRRSVRDRRGSPPPSGLLVRNLPLDARPEDLRIPFERFGPVKDVYLPKDFHTGEPRGFGFVKYRSPDDAAEAKDRMDHKVIGGREIRIVFAEENRKTPREMRTTIHPSGREGRSYRRTPPRSSRQRYRSYSRSPLPARYASRDNDARDDYGPGRSRSMSQSPSRSHEKNYRSHQRSPSPRKNRQSPGPQKDYRQSPGPEKHYAPISKNQRASSYSPLSR